MKNEKITSVETQTGKWFRFIVFVVLVSSSIGAVWWTLQGRFFDPDGFSGFTWTLIKVTIGIGAFWAIDKSFLHEIDTLTELKNGNVAFAIAFLGYCILLASAVASS
jgi:hypothetical protein